MQEKTALRAELKDRRDRYVAGLSPSVANLCFRQFPSPLRAALERTQTIGFYNATGSEAPTERLIEHALEAGWQVALPRTASQGRMAFYGFTLKDILNEGQFGIAEPDASNPVLVPDVIFVPLVGFDRKLRRLGQGGGFYDRFFANYPETLKIGLAWSAQECDPIPCEGHDIALDAILTENELITGEKLS